MKLAKLLQLSHAEVAIRKKTIVLSIIAAGVPLVLLMMISLVAAGVKDIFLDYAARPTEGRVYLAVSVPNQLEAERYIAENNGEVVGEVTLEKTQGYAGVTELLAAMAGLSEEQVAMAPAKQLLEGREWYEFDQIKLLDVFLADIRGYQEPFFGRMENLQATLETQRVLLVRFPTAEDAYDYQIQLRKWSAGLYNGYIGCEEVFTNLLSVYEVYATQSDVLMTIGLVIAGIIVVGTFVYLLDQELHTMIVYRALGANMLDLIGISLGYLLEIAGLMIICVAGVGVVGAAIFSLVNAGYLGGLLREFYHVARPRTLLLGWNIDIVKAAVTILGAALVSLILTLDQFSAKKLSQKLKRD